MQLLPHFTALSLNPHKVYCSNSGVLLRLERSLRDSSPGKGYWMGGDLPGGLTKQVMSHDYPRYPKYSVCTTAYRYVGFHEIVDQTTHNHAYTKSLVLIGRQPERTYQRSAKQRAPERQNEKTARDAHGQV